MQLPPHRPANALRNNHQRIQHPQHPAHNPPEQIHPATKQDTLLLLLMLRHHCSVNNDDPHRALPKGDVVVRARRLLARKTVLRAASLANGQRPHLPSNL